MNKKAVGGAVVVVALALIIAALATGAVYIGLEPPYLFIPSSYQVERLNQPVGFAVAYVYPNNSYILDVWIFNPNAYPIISGASVYETAPKIGFWGPEGNAFTLKPFNFAYEDTWFGMTVNETVYGYTYNGGGFYLQPPASGDLWYNGSGSLLIYNLPSIYRSFGAKSFS